MYGKGKIWCHLGYITKNIDNWPEWIETSNREISFLLPKKWHRIPKGIKDIDLPSFHPFWRRQSRKDLMRSMDMHIANLKVAINDSSTIKFMYNKSTSPKNIQDKIDELHQRIYQSKVK